MTGERFSPPRGYVIRVDGGYWSNNGRVKSLKGAHIFQTMYAASLAAKEVPGIVWSLGLALQEQRVREERG